MIYKSRKMFKNVYYLILFTLVFSSCNFDKKESYILTLDSFITKTNEDYKKFKEQDWKDADSTFNNLQLDYIKIKSELTTEESTQINKLLGKYQAIKVKAGVMSLKSKINDIMEQANSFISEMASDTTLTK